VKPLLIALSLLALIYSTKKGVSFMQSKGLRLNNPGNIRHSNTAWKGKSDLQNDKNFVTFVTPEHGIRALYKNLLTYRNKGYGTIASIITRWAPPTENNTNAYINSVSSKLKLDPLAPIPLDRYSDLIAAIILHENGSQPFPKEIIQRGMNLA
jgi:hypothetical protein